MAYIPKIRQTPGADLEGGSLFTEEGRPYFGPYTQDVVGNFYTGEYITVTSKPLYRVFPEGDLELRPQENFLVFYPKITEDRKSVV